MRIGTPIRFEGRGVNALAPKVSGGGLNLPLRAGGARRLLGRGGAQDERVVRALAAAAAISDPAATLDIVKGVRDDPAMRVAVTLDPDSSDGKALLTIIAAVTDAAENPPRDAQPSVSQRAAAAALSCDAATVQAAAAALADNADATPTYVLNWAIAAVEPDALAAAATSVARQQRVDWVKRPSLTLAQLAQDVKDLDDRVAELTRTVEALQQPAGTQPARSQATAGRASRKGCKPK